MRNQLKVNQQVKVSSTFKHSTMGMSLALVICAIMFLLVSMSNSKNVMATEKAAQVKQTNIIRK